MKYLQYLWPRWVVFIFALVVMLGCNSKKDPEQTTTSSPTLVTLELVVLVSTAQTPAAQAFLGGPEEVVEVQVRVETADKVWVEGQSLIFDGTRFTGSIEVPLNLPLILSGKGLNAAGRVIYEGQTEQTLSQSGDSLTLVLNPIDDGNPNLFPQILSLTYAEEWVRLETGEVLMRFRGEAGEALRCRFFPDDRGGQYELGDQWVTLAQGATEGSCVDRFTAPDDLGKVTHKVKVTNRQGNTTSAEFQFTLVRKKGKAGVQVALAPAIVEVEAKVLEEGVSLTAKVQDDGPLDQITYSWSFNGSTHEFKDATANPLIWEDYEGSQQGELILTVVDEGGTGLSSTLTFLVRAGQWSL